MYSNGDKLLVDLLEAGDHIAGITSEPCAGNLHWLTMGLGSKPLFVLIIFCKHFLAFFHIQI